MKSRIRPLRQSPLRLAILTGFVGLESIDLLEKYLMHYVGPEALGRLHALTAFISLAIVAVCVYLLTVPPANRVRRSNGLSGKKESRRPHVDATRSWPFSDKSGSKSKSASGQCGEHEVDSLVEEQVLALP